MKQSMKPPSLTAFSGAIYRRLLILYPLRFRQEYGREMELVFRSQCRDWIKRHGQGALAMLWLSTFVDLVATALEERMKGGSSMSKTMWVQLSGIFAFIGGLLGLYLLTQGTNEYGNYGWHGELTPVAIILLAIGFAGWFAIYHQQIETYSWLGFAISLVGLVSMAIGYVVHALWFLIFLGPAIVLPIGAILLGIRSSRIPSLPVWWRYFPFVVAAIGVLGFGIEIWEEVVLNNSTPDRGLMTTQLLFSVVWLGLGIGLWLTPKRSASQPGVM